MFKVEVRAQNHAQGTVAKVQRAIKQQATQLFVCMLGQPHRSKGRDSD
jgi:hypothetical protein